MADETAAKIAGYFTVYYKIHFLQKPISLPAKNY
jgi:hypothetical protein